MYSVDTFPVSIFHS